jgi:hypothetical protein
MKREEEIERDGKRGQEQGTENWYGTTKYSTQN